MNDRLTSGRVVIWSFVWALLIGAPLIAQEWKSGVEWKEPPVVAPGASPGAPPADAIVLFDGSDLSQWEGGERWMVADGVAIPQGGDIRTKQTFGDIQLHVEWATPTEVRGEGQGRGNSGVFLMGLYEVQVLDSYGNTTYFDGQAGSIYKQTPPMVNAMRKPGEWNTYDIIFTAPQFKVNGTVSKSAHITVIHNGMVALNHFEILGPTGFTAAPAYTPHAEKGPISLQFHGDPVRFRNLWVRELKPAEGVRVGAPYNIQRRQIAKRDAKEDTAKPEAARDAQLEKIETSADKKAPAPAEKKPDSPSEKKSESSADKKPDPPTEKKPESSSKKGDASS